MAKIRIEAAGRKVKWDGLPDEAAILIIQMLVQAIGPAKEDNE